MESDNRQAALKKLLIIASANGFVTFDDIMQCADEFSLSIGEFDWLAEAAGSRNVIIYDEAPKSVVMGEYDFDDYAQTDYEQIYSEAVEMCPDLEPLINDIRRIVPPQRGEVGYLKYQVKEGNAHARSRMTEMYLRIAVRIAVARAKTYDIDLAETLGDAFTGLVIAVDKYDPDYSGPFVSFASFWIYQNISREQSTQNPNIYFPVHRKEWFYTMYPILKAHGCTECEDILGCRKVINMICEKIQCDPEQSKDVLFASLSAVSLEDIIDVEYDFPSLIYSDEDMLEDMLVKLRAEDIYEALRKLSIREREVLTDRYGLNNGTEKTLEQVGQKYGITRERVRQIESKALKKLSSNKRLGLK